MGDMEKLVIRIPVIDSLKYTQNCAVAPTSHAGTGERQTHEHRFVTLSLGGDYRVCAASQGP